MSGIVEPLAGLAMRHGRASEEIEAGDGFIEWACSVIKESEFVICRVSMPTPSRGHGPGALAFLTALSLALLGVDFADAQPPDPQARELQTAAVKAQEQFFGMAGGVRVKSTAHMDKFDETKSAKRLLSCVFSIKYNPGARQYVIEEETAYQRGVVENKLRGGNQDYTFDLTKLSEKGKWTLHNVSPFAEAAKPAEKEAAPISHELLNAISIEMVNGQPALSFYELMSHPYFRIDRIARGSNSGTRVYFRQVPPSSTPGIASITDGWFDLDEDKYWAVTSYELTRAVGGPGTQTGKTKGEAKFSNPPPFSAIPSSYSLTFSKGGVATHRIESTCEAEGCSAFNPAEFRLTRFGFPEWNGDPEEGHSGRLWLVAGAGFVALGLGLAVRRHVKGRMANCD